MVTLVVLPETPPRFVPTMVIVPLTVVLPVTFAVTDVIIGVGGGALGAPSAVVAMNNNTANAARSAANNVFITPSPEVKGQSLLLRQPT
jgi:hypothetical protein